MRNNRLYIRDILDAITSIEEFVKAHDIESFKKDDLVSSAVTRKFEIIGEAAKNVSEELRNKYDEQNLCLGLKEREEHYTRNRNI